MVLYIFMVSAKFALIKILNDQAKTVPMILQNPQTLNTTKIFRGNNAHFISQFKFPILRVRYIREETIPFYS